MRTSLLRGAARAAAMTAIALFALGAPEALAQSYSAGLTGAAEVPGPGDSDGAGYAVVTISGTSVQYSILTNGIAAPTAAHIHRGAAGVSGPVVVDFNPTFAAGFASGSVTATQAILDEIKGNPSGFYVNVHNAEFTAGAIRGQLTVPAVTEVFYPTVVKAAGQNNTLFVSDLSILNPGTAAATITVELFLQNPAGLTAPSAIRSAVVPAGQQVVVKDVAATLFGATGTTVGAARITSDMPLRFTHRVLNDQRANNAGTSLLNIATATRSDILTEGFLGLLSNASAAGQTAGTGYRTNIGWFNPGSSAVNVTWTAKKNDGSTIGTATTTVPALSQGQQSVFALIGGVTAADQAQADFYLQYTVTGGGLLVYGTVVDNKTGDGIYLAGTPRP